MTPLSLIGLGATASWCLLAALSFTLRDPETDPRSRHRALLIAFALALSALSFPFLATLSSHELPRVIATSSQTLPIVQRAAVQLRDIQPNASSVLSLVASLWLVTALFGVVRLMYRMVALSRVLQTMELPSPDLLARVDALAREMNVLPPRVRIDPARGVPRIAGALFPTVVIPRALANSDSFELALRHELTHLSRKDPLVNGLIGWLSIVFTGHPAATWFLRELSIAREQIVDATVSLLSPELYARLLVDLAHDVPCDAPVGGVAMVTSKLTRRISMLMNGMPVRRAAVQSSLIISVAMSMAFVFAPIARAEPPSPPELITEPQQIQLAIGQSQTFELEGVTRIAVSDPRVFDVSVDGAKRVSVHGVGPGEAQLNVWSSKQRTSYRVVVTAQAQ